MTAQIDLNLQNKARDTLGALGDGSVLTSTAAFVTALTALAERVEAARIDHAAAVDEADRDATENRLAAMELGEAVSMAIGVYRRANAVARLRLVDLDPVEAAEIGAVEVERLRRHYESAFATTPSDLERMGRVNVMTALQVTVDRLAEADEVPKSDRKRLADAVAAIGAKHTALREESHDDAVVADRLYTARSELERQTAALLDVARGVLRTEDSVQTLERLLLQAARKRRGVTEPVEAPAPPGDEPAPATPSSEPEPVV